MLCYFRPLECVENSGLDFSYHKLNSVLVTMQPRDLINLPRLDCYCHHHCPPDVKDEGICSVPWGGRCFAAVEELFNPATGNLEPEYSYGCFPPGDTSFLQCKGHLVDHHIPASILCCDSGNLCNEELRPIYRPTNLTDPNHPFYGTTHSDYFLLQILLGVVFSLLLLTFCIGK